jgi:hypothetical protein
MMKAQTFTLFLVLFLGYTTGWAQPENNAAKSQYTMFYKCLDKLKTLDYSTQKSSFEVQLGQAENHLKNVKKYEPGYNASQMEIDIAVYRNAAGATPKPSGNAGSSGNPSSNSGNANNSNLSWDTKQVENAIRSMKNDGAQAGGRTSADELAVNAEKKLEILRQNHPDYDASGYANEIEQFKTEYNAKQAVAQQKDVLKEEFSTYYELLFEGELNYAAVMIGEDADQAKAQAFIEEYAAKINEFLASDAAALGKDQHAAPALNYVAHLDTRARMGFNMNFYTPTGRNAVLSDFYRLKLEMEWAKGLERLLGEHDEVESSRKNIQAGLDYLKSPEEAVKIAEKNAYEYKASAVIFPEAMHNNALLADIKNAVANSTFGKGKEFIGLRVTQSQWTINRHWLTGTILNRRVHVQMMTNEGGTCYLHDFYATEEYNGNSYQKCYVGFHNKREMLCDKVH